jgi:hypothetical protein
MAREFDVNAWNLRNWHQRYDLAAKGTEEPVSEGSSLITDLSMRDGWKNPIYFRLAKYANTKMLGTNIEVMHAMAFPGSLTTKGVVMSSATNAIKKPSKFWPVVPELPRKR